MSIINQNINFTTKEAIKKFSHGARNLSFLVSPKPIYLITNFLSFRVLAGIKQTVSSDELMTN